MEAFYQIDPDPLKNLVRIRMAGFFSTKDVATFAAAFRQAIARLPRRHSTLVDIKNMKIQSQESVAAFTGFMAAPDIRSARLAFVCTSTLAKLQAERLTDRDTVRYFQDAAEAEEWLIAPAERVE